MATFSLVITDAGRQAIVDATNTGTLPVVLSQVALGTGLWSPDATATALQSEIKRIDTVGGQAVAADTIHVTITDDSADTYSLGEFGLYTDGGVLFAIYSDPAGITDKATDALLLLAADIVLTSVPPGSVTVNGTGFTNPQATETLAGVAKVATQTETDAGTDDGHIVTPKKLAAYAQRKDATLTALASITTAADDLVYASGSDQFSTTKLTAFARNLLDDSDENTARATLGVSDFYAPDGGAGGAPARLMIKNTDDNAHSQVTARDGNLLNFERTVGTEDNSNASFLSIRNDGMFFNPALGPAGSGDRLYHEGYRQVAVHSRISSTSILVLSGTATGWTTYTPLSTTIANAGNYLIRAYIPLMYGAGSASGVNRISTALLLSGVARDIKSENIVATTSQGANQVLSFAGWVGANTSLAVQLAKTFTAFDSWVAICRDDENNNANYSGQLAILEIIQL